MHTEIEQWLPYGGNYEYLDMRGRKLNGCILF